MTCSFKSFTQSSIRIIYRKY